MTKKIRWSVGAILALIALLVAMFHRKIDGMKASLALGMSRTFATYEMTRKKKAPDGAFLMGDE